MLTSRSPAASKNEMATAIAGAGEAGPVQPDWRNQCKLRKDSRGFDLWEMVSPSGKYWLDSTGQWFNLPAEADVTGNFATPTGARMALRLAETPPDVTAGQYTVNTPSIQAKPTYAPDDAEQPERFDEMTGPMDDGQNQSGLFRSVVGLPRVDLYVDGMRVDAVYVKAVENDDEHYDVKRAYWPMSMTSLMLDRIKGDLRRADFTPAQARNIVEAIKHGVAEFPYAALDPTMLEVISDQLLDQRGRGEEERAGGGE
jgi:hypothetical protein